MAVLLVQPMLAFEQSGAAATHLQPVPAGERWDERCDAPLALLGRQRKAQTETTQFASAMLTARRAERRIDIGSWGY